MKSDYSSFISVNIDGKMLVKGTEEDTASLENVSKLYL